MCRRVTPAKLFQTQNPHLVAHSHWHGNKVKTLIGGSLVKSKLEDPTRRRFCDAADIASLKRPHSKLPCDTNDSCLEDDRSLRLWDDPVDCDHATRRKADG